MSEMGRASLAARRPTASNSQVSDAPRAFDAQQTRRGSAPAQPEASTMRASAITPIASMRSQLARRQWLCPFRVAG